MRIKVAVAGAAIVLLPLLVVFPRSAVAQVNLQVQIGLPTIRFETAPVLVEVSPGVQVVPEYEQEVFFVDGWYWHRSGPNWYRTQDHRGGWVVVQRREVPPTLVRIPRGKYKHYKARGPHGHEHGHDNDQGREMPPHGGDAQFKHGDHGDHGDHKDQNDHHDHGERKEHKESKHGHR